MNNVENVFLDNGILRIHGIVFFKYLKLIHFHKILHPIKTRPANILIINNLYNNNNNKIIMFLQSLSVSKLSSQFSNEKHTRAGELPIRDAVK